MKRRAAFTLIEMLVAVTILGLLGVYGFTSYGRFAERMAVEDAAKDLITFIRTAQMRARNGDRGTGACHATVAQIANDSSRLEGWKVLFDDSGAISYPVCTSATEAASKGSAYKTEPFQQSSIKIYCTTGSSFSLSSCRNKYLYTKSVFGDTWFDASKSKTVHIIMGDTASGIFYRFDLNNGSVTNGNFCPGNTIDRCNTGTY